MDVKSNVMVAAAKEMLARQKAEENFYEFCKQAWHIVEGDNPFVDGWVVQCLCEHLQAVAERKIRFLLINAPPRTGKSSILSVMFPAWVWLNKTHERFLYSSYSHNLTTRDSVRCRRVIQSEWYQQRWANKFTIIEDQNTKVRFDNDRSGYRLSVSMNSAVTGDGGSICICLPYGSLISTNLGEMAIGFIVENKADVKINSYNHITNEIEIKTIEAYECNPGRQIIEIELDDRILECTEDHQIYTENRGYVRAKDLQEGDIVLCL